MLFERYMCCFFFFFFLSLCMFVRTLATAKGSKKGYQEGQVHCQWA